MDSPVNASPFDLTNFPETWKERYVWYKSFKRAHAAKGRWKVFAQLPDAARDFVKVEAKRERLWGEAKLLAERLELEIRAGGRADFITLTVSNAHSAAELKAEAVKYKKRLRVNYRYAYNAKRKLAGLAPLKEAEMPVLRICDVIERGERYGRLHIHMLIISDGSIRVADYANAYSADGSRMHKLDADGKVLLTKKGKPKMVYLWPKGFIHVRKCKDALEAAEYVSKYVKNEFGRVRLSQNPAMGFVALPDGYEASRFLLAWQRKYAAKTGRELAISPCRDAVGHRERERAKRFARKAYLASPEYREKLQRKAAMRWFDLKHKMEMSAKYGQDDYSISAMPVFAFAKNTKKQRQIDSYIEAMKASGRLLVSRNMARHIVVGKRRIRRLETVIAERTGKLESPNDYSVPVELLSWFDDPGVFRSVTDLGGEQPPF